MHTSDNVAFTEAIQMPRGAFRRTMGRHRSKWFFLDMISLQVGAESQSLTDETCAGFPTLTAFGRDVRHGRHMVEHVVTIRISLAYASEVFMNRIRRGRNALIKLRNPLRCTRGQRVGAGK